MSKPVFLPGDPQAKLVPWSQRKLDGYIERLADAYARWMEAEPSSEITDQYDNDLVDHLELQMRAAEYSRLLTALPDKVNRPELVPPRHWGQSMPGYRRFLEGLYDQRNHGRPITRKQVMRMLDLSTRYIEYLYAFQGWWKRCADTLTAKEWKNARQAASRMLNGRADTPLVGDFLRSEG